MRKTYKYLRNAFYIALSIKALAGIVRCFLPYDLPHRWRQIDTLGVSIRYWLRWTVESELVAPLLPAVLNSKDHYGITPMEFPLYNLIAAPMFFAGPLVGTVLANALMFSLHILLTLWCSRLWRGVTLFRIPMDSLSLCLVLVSVSSLYLFKFMPDYMSFMLVFIALSGAWNKQWILRSFALASLGLLMKPTSIIVFAFCFLHPDVKRFLRTHLLWIFGSALLTFAYYTFGMDFIRSFQDGEDLFAVHMRHPFFSLVEALSDFKNLFFLLESKLFFDPGLWAIPLLLPFINIQQRKVLAKLCAILMLQILAIFALDGSHSFVHEYYFIGCAPLLLLIVGTLCMGLLESKSRYKNILCLIFFLSCLFKFMDQTQFEFRTMFSNFRDKTLVVKDCQDLKKRHPEVPWGQGLVFRSGDLYYPQAGNCFFEREGSLTSPYGLFHEEEELPSACKKIDQEGKAILATCI